MGSGETFLLGPVTRSVSAAGARGRTMSGGAARRGSVRSMLAARTAHDLQADLVKVIDALALAVEELAPLDALCREALVAARPRRAAHTRTLGLRAHAVTPRGVDCLRTYVAVITQAVVCGAQRVHALSCSTSGRRVTMLEPRGRKSRPTMFSSTLLLPALCAPRVSASSAESGRGAAAPDCRRPPAAAAAEQVGPSADAQIARGRGGKAACPDLNGRHPHLAEYILELVDDLRTAPVRSSAGGRWAGARIRTGSSCSMLALATSFSLERGPAAQ
jgi:hypothetical protein